MEHALKKFIERMSMEKITSRVLAVLGLGCILISALWFLHPSPVELMYGLFSTSPGGERETIYPYYLARLAWPSLALGACALLLAYLLRKFPGIFSEPDKESPFLSSGWVLFLASWLALYFEILGIRWWGSEMRSLAYFKNLTLICAFLGLGGGMLLQKDRRNLLPYFPFVFGLLTFLAVSPQGKILGRLDVPGEGIFFWFQSWSENPAVRTLAFLTFITTIISLQVACFLPLGQLIGRCMLHLPPLKGYSINILGSLIGLWSFSILSFFSLPSWCWFVCGLGLFLVIAAALHRRPLFIIEAVLCSLALLCVFIGDRGSLWSPYYKVEVVPWYLDVVCNENRDVFWKKYYKELPSGTIPWGYGISYNAVYFVNALDTSPGFIAKHPKYKACRDKALIQNLIALEKFSPENKDMLIIASGPGNDIAVALNKGARHIDAVDIDPMAIRLGKRFNPEDPYSDPRVSTYVNDARAFLQQTKKKYEYVLFASLDAQTLLSGMSSIRLDNFIYTVEAIKAAQRVLTSDGILAIVYWGVYSPFVPDRFEAMLKEVFPEDQIWRKGVLFAAGPGLVPYLKNLPASDPGKAINPKTLPTDDWPFIYLRERHIPRIFFWMAFVLMALSALLAHRNPGSFSKFHFDFFCLGAGFLLLETKAVTQMSLLYGTTWFVNAIVFSIILLVILLGNLFISLFPKAKTSYFYLGLGISLMTGYFLDIGTLLELSPVARLILSSVVFGAPFLFAACIFAQKFNWTPQAMLGAALGSNLIGSTLGGVTEYTSLVLGIKFLNIIALAFYGLAFFSHIKEHRSQVP